MIDFSKQTEDVYQAWTDTQKSLWSGLAGATEQQAVQTQLAETWRKSVDTWEEAVKNGLEAQGEWSTKLADNVSAVPNVPKELLAWAEQTQQLGERWNGAQKELWESYFGMVRKAVPVKLLGTFDAQNHKLFSTWQESVENIVAAQSTWAQMFTAQTAAAAAPQAAKTAKATKARSSATV